MAIPKAFGKAHSVESRTTSCPVKELRSLRALYLLHTLNPKSKHNLKLTSSGALGFFPTVDLTWHPLKIILSFQPTVVVHCLPEKQFQHPPPPPAGEK